MNAKLLQKVYEPDSFRQQGHQLIDLLADHLESSLNGRGEKVINYSSPEEEMEFWRGFFNAGSGSDFFQEVLRHTTHVHHPRYIGHQVCAPAPQAALCGLVSSILNNGMAVYEMGMAPTAMERLVTDLLAQKIGFGEGSRGILTSGGTLANLTALLSARKAVLQEDVWLEGHGKRLAVMVSEEAHYCIDRAARIMGLGTEGIIKVPVKADFSIDTSLLKQAYEAASNKGLHIFALVGSAPSTATGVYDDLDTLADFCKEKGLWFHVDAAHGGAAVFSKKYRKTMQGIDRADSVVIDGHKMMLMSTITTALLFRDGSHSHTTFSQEAEYLLQHSDEEDWFNLAKRTFECTKTMMSLQWYLLWKTYGEELFDANVTTLYDLGGTLAGMIEADPHLELATAPHSNIVCFRFVEPGLSSGKLDQINKEIRQELLEDGVFYIVQTRIKGTQYLRCTIMNPFTTEEHLRALLDRILNTGRNRISA
ncbi:pyridoxal phosphate-dependent decarboxylase family protein [Muriicola marianensis]|uniref:Pyridoxal-dependent decarboxylase n=1 Tax=Muriicola marianensis TaxID=1324801 RepID=A0ABQ1R8U7_9FLAO|nr:aminotransferase class I/II-fold pyridoxal phosphate-dependent enzyme [Muriicola marianensis]GGD58789.1 pyridoxal-dependent decarboxylase [Muriicola marianensis]